MDPISDMLIRIKNAQAVFKETVFIPVSKLKLEIARVLKHEGFIENYQHIKTEKKIVIKLKYQGKRGAITLIERISKPGRRMYAKNNQIPVVLKGLGIVILSTSRGVMTGYEAKKKGIGGELICKIW